jgi:hypothetical protein
MAGTREGGVKTRETIKVKYGGDYYARLGNKGGSAPHSKPRGFAANKDLARRAGAVGGRISRRAKKADMYLPLPGTKAAQLAAEEEHTEVAKNAEKQVMSFEVHAEKKRKTLRGVFGRA